MARELTTGLSERAILARVRTRRRTIGRTLVAAVLLLLVPLITAQITVFVWLGRARDAAVVADTLDAAATLAAATDAALHEVVSAQEAAAGALAALPEGREAAHLLEWTRRPHPALRALVWYGPEGRPRASSPADASPEGWPAPRVPPGRFAVSPVARSVAGGPTVWVAVPVRGARSRDGGVLVGQLLVATFAGRIHHPAAKRGQAVLLDAAGHVMFSAGTPDLPTDGRDWSTVAPVSRARRGEPAAARRAVLPGRAESTLAAFAPVGSVGWVAGVTRPADAAVAAGRSGIATMVVVSLVALFLGLAGAIVTGRRLARPLERLAASARGLAGGEGQVVVAPGAAEEYTQLARAVAHAIREARKRAADLDTTRRQLAALLEAVPEPTVLMDADRRVAAANPPAQALLGGASDGTWAPHPPLDLAGRSVPEDALPTSQALATGKRAQATLQIGAPGGDRRVFAAEATPVVDEDGRPIGALLVCRDLTERREAERRIAELSSELRLRTDLAEALLSRVPAAVALVQGTDMRLRAANARFFELTGAAPPREAPGLAGAPVVAAAAGRRPPDRRLADVFPPRVAEQVAGWVTRARETGQPDQGRDVRIEGAKQEAYWTYAAAPLRDGAGPRDLLVLLAISDTTEDVATRVKAQRAVERVEQKGAELDAVLQSLTDGVVLLDDNARIVAMNRAAEQVLGRTPEKGVAPRLEDFPRLAKLYEPSGRVIPPAEWPSTRALAGETVGRQEAYILTEAREKRFLSLTAVPLRSRRGRLLGAAATFRDITREKEVESFKLQFITRAAHELRTPLTTIKGNILLALKGRFGALSASQEGALATAARSVDSMVSLIDDLLDITRIESGRLRLFGEEVSLGAILDRALAGIRTLADAKGVAIAVHPSMADVVGYWDAAKVAQVFANALSNAVKFTPAGGRVELRAYREAHLVTVAIRDTGVGIARDKLALVFQPFVSLHRAEAGAPRQRGTGLGLSIAQSIVEAHGGRMWAESEGTGRGTTIYFTLPLDHRRAERARINLPARVRAGETSIEPSVIADLSADGASILAPNEVLAAKELTVEIQMPTGGAVTATGAVVRVEPVEGGTQFKAGVRFEGLPESARTAILEFVRRERGGRAAG